jgi:uncharacterized phiE125 gp8 family phage protein
MPTLLTAPTAEPVTLAEAKLAARVDSTALDTMIPGLITAAREQSEQIAGQRWVTQVWRHELADWPAADAPLPQYGATAVAVSYWDGAAWQALPGSAYEYAPAPGGGTVLVPAPGAAWPTLGARSIAARVRVDITSGGDVASVPQVVKLYIKSMVAAWVDNPSALADGKAESSPWLHHLLDSVRVYG